MPNKKSFKKFIVLLCVAVITLSVPIGAAEKLRITSDGLFVSLKAEPLNKDNALMVTVDDYNRILKAKAVWDITTKTAVIRKGDAKLQISVSTGEANLNGEAVDITPPAVISGDTAYLPLRAVCELFDAKVSWDSKENVISIDTGSSFLALDAGSIIDDETTVLSYKEAVNRAIAENNSIKNLNDNIDLIEKSLELSEFAFYNAPYMPYDKLIEAVRGLKASENNLSAIPLNEELLKDLSEFMVFNSATSIETMKLDIKLLEESIALEEENIKSLELKNKLGIVSDNEVKTAKISADTNKANLELLYTSLDAEYQTLNRLLKKDLKSKTIVSYEPNFTKLNIPNMEGYISDKVSNAPTIKMKELSLEQAEYKKNTSSYEVDETGVDLIKTENEYRAAERDLNDSKLDLEKTIRSLFTNLKQLEGKEKTLELDLEKAINNYNNAIINYDAGNIIMYQVEQARLGVLKVEVDIQKNRIAYDRLKFLIGKPYLSSAQQSQ